MQIEGMRQRSQQCVVVSAWDEACGVCAPDADGIVRGPEVTAFVVGTPDFEEAALLSGLARPARWAAPRIVSSPSSLHFAGERGRGVSGFWCAELVLILRVGAVGNRVLCGFPSSGGRGLCVHGSGSVHARLHSTSSVA